jgi:hypothetical protein
MLMKVQRLSRKRVPSSEGKFRASTLDDDIVWSIWKHIAVRVGMFSVYYIDSDLTDAIYIGMTKKDINTRFN